MKLTTLYAIKDVTSLAFITTVLIRPDISNWWVLLGMAALFGSYSTLDNNK